MLLCYAYCAGTGLDPLPVLQDPNTGRSRGHGIVEYDNPRDAMAAIARMNGSMLDERQIMVREDQKQSGEGRAPAC